MQDAAWDAVVIETVFLDGESINQLLLMMSRRNLPLVSVGDRAKAESHLCNYPAARDHVTLLGTATRGDCQPLMLRLASLLKRLVQSNKPADTYSIAVTPQHLHRKKPANLRGYQPAKRRSNCSSSVFPPVVRMCWRKYSDTFTHCACPCSSRNTCRPTIRRVSPRTLRGSSKYRSSSAATVPYPRLVR